MTYLLTAPVQFEQTIKKSRFLTQVISLRNSTDAASEIARLATPKASHNCWAWKVGEDHRFNDDGEPGGTAGRPMLAAIEHHGFDRILAVCTRWYGGIQLGTGGLARAYGDGVHQCLLQAPRRRYIPRQRLRGHCPYSQISLLQARLAELNVLIESEEFDADGAIFTVAAPLDRVDMCRNLMLQLTDGKQEFISLDA